MFNKDVIGRARAGSATNVIGGLKHDGDSVDHKDVETYDGILEMLLVPMPTGNITQRSIVISDTC